VDKRKRSKARAFRRENNIRYRTEIIEMSRKDLAFCKLQLRDQFSNQLQQLQLQSKDQPTTVETDNLCKKEIRILIIVFRMEVGIGSTEHD
jgi:hypothetical protein